MRVIVWLLFTLPAFAAEDFILWQSAEFAGPFHEGVIAVSPAVANSSGNNSVKVSLRYDDIEPDVCQCQIFAVIEEEIALGVWIAAAPQNEAYGVEGNAPSRVLILRPGPVDNPGVDLVIQTPSGDTRISETNGTAPSKFRVRILVQGGGSLQSLTVTGYGRKFNQ